MQMKSSHAYNRICYSSYINLSQFLCVEHKHNLCLIQPRPGQESGTQTHFPATPRLSVRINYDILLLFCHMCHRRWGWLTFRWPQAVDWMGGDSTSLPSFSTAINHHLSAIRLPLKSSAVVRTWSAIAQWAPFSFAPTIPTLHTYHHIAMLRQAPTKYKKKNWGPAAF